MPHPKAPHCTNGCGAQHALDLVTTVTDAATVTRHYRCPHCGGVKSVTLPVATQTAVSSCSLLDAPCSPLLSTRPDVEPRSKRSRS